MNTQITLTLEENVVTALRERLARRDRCLAACDEAQQSLRDVGRHGDAEAVEAVLRRAVTAMDALAWRLVEPAAREALDR